MTKSYRPINSKYISTTGIRHNRELLSTIIDSTAPVYMASRAGALIKFSDAGLYKMIMVHIIGNGYGSLQPVNTVVHGYHYQSVGNFLNCSQFNCGGRINTCKWKIVDNVIALWIPTFGAYTSVTVEAYESVSSYKKIPITVTMYDSEPTGSNTTNCTVFNTARYDELTHVIGKTIMDVNSIGSANNGTYIRFNNGVQMTWQRYTVTSASTWGSWGSNYSSSIAPSIQNFPIAFNAVPCVIANLETDSVNGWLATRSEEGAQATTTKPAAYQIVRGSSSSGAKNFIISIFAIGTWK